ALFVTCLGRALTFAYHVKRSTFDEVVALDVTQSMNVMDYRLNGQAVSRLAFAKHALRQALLELPCGSTVGWALSSRNGSQPERSIFPPSKRPTCKTWHGKPASRIVDWKMHKT
ncbi:MAG: hypothetical protein M3Z37_06165, partial [Candidatus Eremiobacteraeota bacterium]|nr:hypothetical protein [Candidatus Eremiobacteraeota bacterium]